MEYGKIIKQAWHYVWNNKYLWILGFLALFSGGGGVSTGGTNFNFRNPAFPSGGSSPTQPFPSGLEDLEEIWPALLERVGMSQSDVRSIIGVIVALCLCLCIVNILLYLLGLMARGGLIFAIDKLEGEGTTGFSESMRAGRSVLGRAFWMRFLLQLPNLLFLIIFGAVFGLQFYRILSAENPNVADFSGLAFGALGLFIPLVCLLSIYGLVTGFIDAYAFRGYVLHDLRLMAGIKHGWQLFRANLGDSLILGVLVTVINAIIGFIIGMIFVILFLATMMPIFLPIFSGEFEGMGLGTFLPLIIVFALFIIITYIISTPITAWRSAVFTLAYRNHFSADYLPQPKEKSPYDLPSSPYSS